jgi:hypothetical protein
MASVKVSDFNTASTNNRPTIVVGTAFRGSDGALYMVDGDETGGGQVVIPPKLPSTSVLAVSGASGTQTSTATVVSSYPSIAYQVAWSANSGVGSIDVEATVNGSTWSTLSFGSQPSYAGASGSLMLNIETLGIQQTRVKITISSGTVTLAVSIAGGW